MAHFLLLILAAAASCVASAQAGALGRIDAYLVKGAPQDALPSANFELARKMLADELAQNGGKPSMFNRGIVQALQDFVALADVEHRCDADAYQVIRANLGRVGGEQAERVEQVIATFRKQHARECLPQLEAAFEGAVKQLESTVGDKLTDLLEALIMRLGEQRATLQPEDFKARFETILSVDALTEREGAIVGAVLREQLGDEPAYADSLSVASRVDGAQALVKSALLEPCTKYSLALRNILDSASFEQLEPSEFFATQEYMASHAGLHLCDLLERDQTDVARGVAAVFANTS